MLGRDSELRWNSFKIFENLRYDLKKLLWKAELNPRVRCAFGNVYRWHIQNRQLHKWNSFGGSVQFLDSLTVQAVQIRAVEVCVCASLAAEARYRGRYIREGDVCVHIVQWQGTLRRMHSDPDQPDLAPHLWDKMSKSLTSSKWGRRPEQQQVMEK